MFVDIGKELVLCTNKISFIRTEKINYCIQTGKYEVNAEDVYYCVGSLGVGLFFFLLCPGSSNVYSQIPFAPKLASCLTICNFKKVNKKAISSPDKA